MTTTSSHMHKSMKAAAKDMKATAKDLRKQVFSMGGVIGPHSLPASACADVSLALIPALQCMVPSLPASVQLRWRRRAHAPSTQTRRKCVSVRCTTRKHAHVASFHRCARAHMHFPLPFTRRRAPARYPSSARHLCLHARAHVGRPLPPRAS